MRPFNLTAWSVDMKELWEQVEQYLKAHQPEALKSLAPPATDNEITNLEKELGVTLPKDFVECLKIHNGQLDDAMAFFAGLEFLSTERILAEWKVWKELSDGSDFDDLIAEPQNGIKACWWNPLWIPFTYNGSGDNICLDLDPDIDGTIGQVITLWHDSSERECKAVSFTEWFTNMVKKNCA